MFDYFSNRNLSWKNGQSATVKIIDYFKLKLLSLFLLIPVVGSILYIVILYVIGFREGTAPSVANYIKFQLIVSIIVLALFIIAIILLIVAGANLSGISGYHI